MIIWVPVVIGLVHQFLLAFVAEDNRVEGGIGCIYVFVKPPENICPLVSLEYQWWIVLLLGSAIAAISAYSERFPGIPRRVALPIYAYVLFLLILVKPV